MNGLKYLHVSRRAAQPTRVRRTVFQLTADLEILRAGVLISGYRGAERKRSERLKRVVQLEKPVVAGFPPPIAKGECDRVKSGQSKEIVRSPHDHVDREIIACVDPESPDEAGSATPSGAIPASRLNEECFAPTTSGIRTTSAKKSRLQISPNETKASPSSKTISLPARRAKRRIASNFADGSREVSQVEGKRIGVPPRATIASISAEYAASSFSPSACAPATNSPPFKAEEAAFNTDNRSWTVRKLAYPVSIFTAGVRPASTMEQTRDCNRTSEGAPPSIGRRAADIP